jgi:transposase
MSIMHHCRGVAVKLRQVDVLMGQGMPRIDAIRQISATEQTYYRWKKKYMREVVRPRTQC